MLSYRRAKLSLEALCCFTPKIFPKAPIPRPNAQITSIQRSILAPIRANNYGFSSFSSISRKSLSNNGLGETQFSPFLSGAKRYYYVDRNRVQHFRPRGSRRWFQNPRNIFVMVVVSSGVIITVYFGNLETVPYTKRNHFVIFSKSMERRLGETNFKQLKDEFKGKILPEAHPDSVRVKLIADDIIKSLQKGLGHDQVWSDLDYGSESQSDWFENKDLGQNKLLEPRDSEGEEKVEANWFHKDEILDDKWVQETRKKGQERGAKSATSHLDGLIWEVIVVNDPLVNAFCLPGGKIVVFTGLLDHFKTDGEIATIIGHEVGHAVARHSAESMTKNLWFAILQLVLYQFVTPDIVNTMSSLFLRLPFSRRMEMEADYIGLLLIASAGYDPAVAPTVYEKLGKVTGGDSALRDYLSTHPSGKKRAQLLVQADVMEEAQLIYRNVKAGHGIEGFL